MSRPHSSFVLILFAVVPVVAAGVIGNLATLPNIPTWYAGLIKPTFNPPNAVFGPVWTTLYVMMAVAFWRILRLSPRVTGRASAIGWFLTQMLLNALWSVAFFGLHAPLYGLVVIALLIACLFTTLTLFWRIDTLAGILLIPYLAWVLFASVLNAAIWQLNG